jgi:hypothetical protein
MAGLMAVPDASFVATTSAGDAGVFAGRDLGQGEVLGPLPCTAVSAAPTRYTVQIGRARHIEVGVFAFLNHSCAPNLELDTARMLVLAARTIVTGEELAFFYPATEWEMAAPFTCRCGQPGCIGRVMGARSLPERILRRYALSPHVRALLADRGRSVRVVGARA